MEIKFTDRFDYELQVVYDFIAKDSTKRADNFINEITGKIMILSSFPYIGTKKEKILENLSIKDM